jgi:PadR family transcriptional regulator PadR
MCCEVVIRSRSGMSHWETQLRKGVVELAVLATVARGETYGYRIVEQLSGLAGLEFTESTIYPVLTRLARDGALSIRTEASPAGPSRRYYRLTADGERRFLQISESWGKVSRSLSGLLEGAQR